MLAVYNAKGNKLADNDDSIGPDSYLRFNVPEDGDYCLSVRDQMHRGGPTFVYRVEVRPVQPDVAFTIPEVVKDSQERQTIVVPRGNRFASMIRMTEGGFRRPAGAEDERFAAGTYRCNAGRPRGEWCRWSSRRRRTRRRRRSCAR